MRFTPVIAAILVAAGQDIEESPDFASVLQKSSRVSLALARSSWSWLLCSGPGHCSDSDPSSFLQRYKLDPASLAAQVPSDLSFLPAVGQATYSAIYEQWRASPPFFGGSPVTLNDIAAFMKSVLATNPFGLGPQEVPWLDFDGSPGRVAAVTQRQLAYIISNALMGNSLALNDGLSAALKRCTVSGHHDSIVMSQLAVLAVLSSELGNGNGKFLAGISPGGQDEEWQAKLASTTLTKPNVCDTDSAMTGAPFEQKGECGLQEFMGGSQGQAPPDFQALTDIAGGVVGGGAQLCEVANSQDESLVIFYGETLAYAFFRSNGNMLQVPWTLLGSRRYLDSLSGQTSADPPYRNVCGMVQEENWLNGNIRKTVVSVSIAGQEVEMYAGSFVAVASTAYWVKNPDCSLEEAQNNMCKYQRTTYDLDISLWYQAFEVSKYNAVVQGAFSTLVKRIGTGPWGSGVWWGDSQMYFLVMWLATSLTGSAAMRALDYYVYNHFCENPGNQCFVLGGPNACQQCINAGGMAWAIYPSNCGQAGIKEIMDHFQGRPALDLYRALQTVGAPPAQVFDTILASGPSPPEPSPTPRPPAPSPIPSQDWVQLAGLNCYPGNGADLVPGSPEPAGVRSLSSCQQLCSGTAGCTAIVMPSEATQSQAQCFLRQAVAQADCVPNSPYSTWLQGESTPTSPPTTPAPTTPVPSTPAPNTPAPTPPAPTSAPGGWTEKPGLNCYPPGVGGSLVPGSPEPAGVMDLAACQATCSSTAGCTAIVMPSGASTGETIQCFLRQDVIVESCAPQSPYTTWLKGGEVAPPPPAPAPPNEEWTRINGMNCYPGNGANVVPGAPEPAGVMGLSACEDLCSTTHGCTAVVMPSVNSGTTECFLRQDVAQEACVRNSPYSTWLRGGSGVNRAARMPGRNCFPGPGATHVPGETKEAHQKLRDLESTPCQ